MFYSSKREGKSKYEGEKWTKKIYTQRTTTVTAVKVYKWRLSVAMNLILFTHRRLNHIHMSQIHSLAGCKTDTLLYLVLSECYSAFSPYFFPTLLALCLRVLLFFLFCFLTQWEEKKTVRIVGFFLVRYRWCNCTSDAQINSSS